MDENDEKSKQNDNKFKEVVIAAYLHDVGKFAQRADIQELYNKNLEGQYCKTTKDGRYTHQHVIYTQGFIDKYRNVLPDKLDVFNINKFASYHHNPSDFEENLISVADCLSSGSDRTNILGIEKADQAKNDDFDGDETKLKFYEKPMIHLMSTLQIQENENQKREKPKESYYSMKALENDNILCNSDKKISKEDYKNLWKEFESDFTKLQGLNYEEFILALDSLLERYWWCIPSATNLDADISLYQHARTTAAFAAALYRFHESNKNENSLKSKNEKKFLFVNGDISGIQKYIFELKTTSDSSKLLRAKSFELWALSEILSNHIVKKFHLSQANVVMSAGGKFILLLANTTDAKNKLQEIQLKIEEYFLNEFAGKLAIIISDGVEASFDDLMQQKMQSLFNKIGDEADKAKQKKMQKALAKNGAILEKHYEDLQKNGECPKCGIFAASEPNCECKNCEKLTEIGTKLVHKNQISIYYDELKHFGQMIKITDSKDKKDFGYTINEFVAGKPLMHIPYVAPQKDDKLLTFEEIANLSKGNNKIAMFKADIDNLGLVFSSSLGERISLSRYADLSKMLHYFFSAFYAWFVKNHKDSEGNFYKDKIYTVFSGGDDLCILGSWNSVMEFALDFKNELDKFTNNNSSITISGGIALANSKIPVADIADMAEELLEKSKKLPNKNSISVFDTTVSWKDYEKLLNEGKWLENQMNEETVSRGVIYKMIDFSHRAQKINSGNIKELLHNNLWKSNLKYLVSRNIKDETIKNRILNNTQNPKDMQNYCIAVSYALYTQRNNSKEDK